MVAFERKTVTSPPTYSNLSCSGEVYNTYYMHPAIVVGEILDVNPLSSDGADGFVLRDSTSTEKSTLFID